MSVRLACSLLLILLSLPLNAWAQWFEGSENIMGTQVVVSLWSPSDAKGSAAVAGVMDIMRGVDNRLSPYKESSELAQLNARAFKAPVVLSTEMAFLYEQSQAMYALTDGAFDIAYASVGKLYNYREKKAPSKADIERLLPALNTAHLSFDNSAKTLQFLNADVAIDLGGIAKGYAVDLAITYLREQGIQNAYVSAGGDSRVLGDRGGRPWLIGIKNPRMQKDDDKETVITLPLEDVAVSTSGDYERFFIDSVSGQRIHHIINPKTGRSASEVMSVTIIGGEGVRTDPLSTAVFVLGVQKGINLVNKLQNYDAIIIDRAGQVHYSNGLMPPAS
ncbi:FAD:protein FMN transferase [Marinagarivorans cellulosilyticus]|uniref:FAD:protein FMN transferase n=1 Tax=Marinagarivorans cellulosilyticus TaxID=2721545 RepID=A0AAN1WK65_9GAMM|nr:FAD:protein FMN transferase [Marinagarivorans cellulosilyticus]